MKLLVLALFLAASACGGSFCKIGEGRCNNGQLQSCVPEYDVDCYSYEDGDVSCHTHTYGQWQFVGLCN